MLMERQFFAIFFILIFISPSGFSSSGSDHPSGRNKCFGLSAGRITNISWTPPEEAFLTALARQPFIDMRFVAELNLAQNPLTTNEQIASAVAFWLAGNSIRGETTGIVNLSEVRRAQSLGTNPMVLQDRQQLIEALPETLTASPSFADSATFETKIAQNLRQQNALTSGPANQDPVFIEEQKNLAVYRAQVAAWKKKMNLPELKWLQVVVNALNERLDISGQLVQDGVAELVVGSLYRLKTDSEPDSMLSTSSTVKDIHHPVYVGYLYQAENHQARLSHRLIATQTSAGWALVALDLKTEFALERLNFEQNNPRGHPIHEAAKEIKKIIKQMNFGPCKFSLEQLTRILSGTLPGCTGTADHSVIRFAQPNNDQLAIDRIQSILKVGHAPTQEMVRSLTRNEFGKTPAMTFFMDHQVTGKPFDPSDQTPQSEMRQWQRLLSAMGRIASAKESVRWY